MKGTWRPYISFMGIGLIVAVSMLGQKFTQHLVLRTFERHMNLGQTAANSGGVSVGDLNGDGRPGLVFYDSMAKTTCVYLTSGAKSFRKVYTLPTGSRIPFAITVADLNKDGKADIVVGYVESRGSVFFNTGGGRDFVEAPWNDGKGVVY
jgi:FG-GAP-like repeat